MNQGAPKGPGGLPGKLFKKNYMLCDNMLTTRSSLVHPSVFQFLFDFKFFLYNRSAKYLKFIAVKNLYVSLPQIFYISPMKTALITIANVLASSNLV